MIISMQEACGQPRVLFLRPVKEQRNNLHCNYYFASLYDRLGMYLGTIDFTYYK